MTKLPKEMQQHLDEEARKLQEHLDRESRLQFVRDNIDRMELSDIRWTLNRELHETKNDASLLHSNDENYHDSPLFDANRQQPTLMGMPIVYGKLTDENSDDLIDLPEGSVIMRTGKLSDL